MISLACNSILYCEFVDNSNYGYDISNAIDYLQMLSFLKAVETGCCCCFCLVQTVSSWCPSSSTDKREV